jgi:hypothetical protein
MKSGGGSLYGRDSGDAPAQEVGVFLPVGEVFPGVKASEQALVEVLSVLSRDDTLFMCARLNIIVSGSGDFEVLGSSRRSTASAVPNR